MELIIHVDGGARGNPGPAGAGVVIAARDGRLVFEAGYFLGTQTNNVAEYTALVRALERAQHCAAQHITIYSDSELLVRQLTGEYRVKNARLAKLYQQAQLLLLKAPRWTVRHVRREANKRADELANLAMNRRANVIVFDVDADEDSRAASEVPGEEPAAEPTETHAAEGPACPVPEQGAVRVLVATPPDAALCPAAAFAQQSFTIQSMLPAGICIHAAHAILPTVLAMLNTEPQEFAAVPTLTVRCARPGCGAVFQLVPLPGPNGRPRSSET